MRYAQSFLLQAIEEFLIAEQLEEQPLYKAELLAQAYQKIGLSKHLKQQSQKWERQLKRQSERGTAYRKGQYALAKLRYQGPCGINHNLLISSNFQLNSIKLI